MFNQSVEFPSTPSISSLLTYPPNLFGTRIRVQRLGAKTDPRRRPILVWRPYKTPSPPTSPPAPRRDWRGTRPYRRRVGVPHLAAAAADGVYPLTVAAVATTTSPSPPRGTPGMSSPASPSPDLIVAVAGDVSLHLVNMTELSTVHSMTSIQTTLAVASGRYLTVASGRPDGEL